mgnify:CR=1 FL=1
MRVMILFNKLNRTDLLLLIAVVLLFMLKAGSERDFVLGCISPVLIISMANHIAHYKQTKKLY